MKYLTVLVVSSILVVPILGLQSSFRTTPRSVELEQKARVRRAAKDSPSPTLEPTHPEPTHEPTHAPTEEPTHEDDMFTDSDCKLVMPSESTEECEGATGSTESDLPLCVGIRGNGPRIWAHFPALARAVEAFGPISGVAGGSSASITSFLLESIVSNPLIVECSEDACCDDVEQRARISFLLKSIEQIRASEALIDPTQILINILLEIERLDIVPRLKSDDPEVQNAALEDLLDLLSKDNVASFVNSDFVTLLKTSSDPIFHATDILAASTQNFAVRDDPLVLIRPYIVNFAALADIIDSIASFYAGLEPLDWETFNILLTDCAIPNVGKDWGDIQNFDTSIGQTCGELFVSLYQNFLLTRHSSDPRRLDDFLGETLITTAVLRGEAVPTWQQAVKDYKDAMVPVNFDVNFSDVSFGYYGDETSLNRVKRNIPVLFDDAKSKKFLSLGPATWRDVLVQSPAEPTLSRGVPILNDSMVSIGGWSDPVPAQVLTSMGCDRIVLINRPGGQGQFGLDVATLLGASSDDLNELYLLDDAGSGFSTALREADATYCADWERQPQFNVTGIIDEGYIAPLLSEDTCILSLDVGAVDDDIRGCTP